MQFDTSYLTAAGREIATTDLGGLDQIQYTKAVASSDDYSSLAADDLRKLTTLNGVEQTVDYSKILKKDTTTLTLRVDFPSEDVKTPYELYTVGFYAKLKSGDEVLYAVLPSDTPDQISAYDGKSNVNDSFTINTTVSNTSDVDFSLTAAGTLTESDLDTIFASRHVATTEDIDGKLKDYYTKSEVDAKFVTDDDFASKLPKNIATTDAANVYTKSQTLAGGATDGNGNAYATTKDMATGDASTLTSAKGYTDAATKPLATSASVTAGDSSTLATAKSYTDTIGKAKVNVADTSNWQQQALFSAGSYTAGAVPAGSDYATYVKANFAKPGVYFVRDDKTSTTADGRSLSVVDSMLTSEGSGYFYGSGVTVYGDAVYRAITPSSDTGWQRALKAGETEGSMITNPLLTASDDAYNLSPGVHPFFSTLPKNAPTGVVDSGGRDWGYFKMTWATSSGPKYLEFFDVFNHHLVTSYSGNPATWRPWEIPNYSGLKPFLEGICHEGADMNNEIVPGNYYSNSDIKNGPPGMTNYSGWSVDKAGDANVIHQTLYHVTGEEYHRTFYAGTGWGPWKGTVLGNGNNTITVNGTTYAPVQSDPTSGNVAKVHNFVSGLKINGHLINVDPTNGLTIDGTPLINIVADEATAKAKSANDKLHLWVTKE